MRLAGVNAAVDSPLPEIKQLLLKKPINPLLHHYFLALDQLWSHSALCLAGAPQPEDGQVWFLSCSGCWGRSHGGFCSRFPCWGGTLSGSWAVGYGHSVHCTTQLELKCLCGIKTPGENLVSESLCKLPQLTFGIGRWGLTQRALGNGHVLSLAGCQAPSSVMTTLVFIYQHIQVWCRESIPSWGGFVPWLCPVTNTAHLHWCSAALPQAC